MNRAWQARRRERAGTRSRSRRAARDSSTRRRACIRTTPSTATTAPSPTSASWCPLPLLRARDRTHRGPTVSSLRGGRLGTKRDPMLTCRHCLSRSCGTRRWWPWANADSTLTGTFLPRTSKKRCTFGLCCVRYASLVLVPHDTHDTHDTHTVKPHTMCTTVVCGAAEVGQGGEQTHLPSRALGLPSVCRNHGMRWRPPPRGAPLGLAGAQ
jgi:hypothetical protein